MCRDEAFELHDRVPVPPQRQVRIDPRLQRGQAQLIEPGDVALEALLEREVRERRPAPERERVLENPSRIGGPAGGQRRSALVDRRLEALRVDGAGRDPQLVARRPGHEQARLE